MTAYLLSKVKGEPTDSVKLSFDLMGEILNDHKEHQKRQDDGMEG